MLVQDYGTGSYGKYWNERFNYYGIIHEYLNDSCDPLQTDHETLLLLIRFLCSFSYLVAHAYCHIIMLSGRLQISKCIYNLIFPRSSKNFISYKLIFKLNFFLGICVYSMLLNDTSAIRRYCIVIYDKFCL